MDQRNTGTNESPDFSSLEKILQKVFKVGDEFRFENQLHTIKISGKPSPSRGECKTDLYLSTVDESNKEHEFKISIKKDDYEFLENKISLDRATEIFGPPASEIISRATRKLKEKFKDSKLIYPYDKEKEDFNITLGWKFELFKDTNRKLSCELELDRKQKLDVLCGTNLSEDKKNSSVSGEVIQCSGVANFIAEYPSDLGFLEQQSVDYFVSKFESIEGYLDRANVIINGGFTALNYRSDKDKWDGNRPLAVWVEWSGVDSQLKCRMIYSDPLTIKGNEVGQKVQDLLSDCKLGVSSEDAIQLDDFLGMIKNKDVICKCGAKNARGCTCTNSD